MTIIPSIDIVDALASEYAHKSPSEILALENRYKDIANNEWESCQHYLNSLIPKSQNINNNPPINWWV